MAPTPRIFVSAASADLRSTRRAVAEALLKLECLPKVQALAELALVHRPLTADALTLVLKKSSRGPEGVVTGAGVRAGDFFKL